MVFSPMKVPSVSFLPGKTPRISFVSPRSLDAAHDYLASDGPFSPKSNTPVAERIAIEQTEALFNAVTLGVLSAAAGAILLAAILQHLGALNSWIGALWVLYIVLCAGSHILLRRAYRSRRAVNQWRPWAITFTAISLAEGIAWGWAPIGLTTGSRFEVELVVVIVTFSVAAGAIPAFSAYLPAFFALFLPATIPFLISSIVSVDPVQRASSLLTMIFVPAMGGLGVVTNRSFKHLVGLRMRTEEMAADLQRQKAIAERASAAKTTFLAAASHDLRQPVHALSLLVGALRGIDMPQEARRIIEQMEVSTNAMDGLFTALLDISRLDAGVVEVHRRRFCVGSLLERICPDYVEETRRKGITLVWKPCAALVDCDPLLIERILRNLISNAVRYTDHGRIVIGCRRRGSRIVVQVWDTGPGISPDQQEQVFQEYYQLGNPERDRTKGLGLGLAIVRRLTDLLECPLRLRSQPGRGSCFEVSIMRAAGIASEFEPILTVLAGALAKGLIVVIDDEFAVRQAMSTLLTGWGHHVIAAGSGEEAMQQLATFPVRPDLIICDYRLRDGENGIEIIERLRTEYNERLAGMLITGDTAPDRLAEARASGLLLLHKPVPNGKLRAAIVNLMATTEAPIKAELSTVKRSQFPAPPSPPESG
jgi:two-component system, sensor histidine kinase